MGIPHPIPYQGSKRGLARSILLHFPPDCERLIEPFAGSAAVSLAAAYYHKAKSFVLNDINKPLMSLWEEIINRPEDIAKEYRDLWYAQQGQERKFYDFAREQFNKTQSPSHLLYLLARCVKASIRYNSNGDFNQSPDNRRRGAHPKTMRANILAASRLLRGKSSLKSSDYREIIVVATTSDMVYLDPPYQGVCENRDRRYIGSVSFDQFVEALEFLDKRGIPFIVSYDGRTGQKRFGKPLPDSLRLTHLEVEGGRSSQATLLGRSAKTIESLYLSPALVARIAKVSLPMCKSRLNQGTLFQPSL